MVHDSDLKSEGHWGEFERDVWSDSSLRNTVISYLKKIQTRIVGATKDFFLEAMPVT